METQVSDVLRARCFLYRLPNIRFVYFYGYIKRDVLCLIFMFYSIRITNFLFSAFHSILVWLNCHCLHRKNNTILTSDQMCLFFDGHTEAIATHAGHMTVKIRCEVHYNS